MLGEKAGRGREREEEINAAVTLWLTRETDGSEKCFSYDSLAAPIQQS